MIRVVLVDDHELVRTGFRMILAGQADIEIVGEAGNGEDGLALIKKLKPDVALMDVHMPGISGIEVTERVRRNRYPTRVVVLTVKGEAPYPRRLLNAGAAGFLTKACPAEELLRAVRQVHAGRRFLSADVAQQLALDSLPGAEVSPFEELSARELEVALMLAHGRSMPEIAEKLHVSAKTIATYKYRLFDKLGVDNPIALANLCKKHALLDQSEADIA